MKATARSLCNGLFLLGLMGLGACGSSSRSGGATGAGGGPPSSGGARLAIYELYGVREHLLKASDEVFHSGNRGSVTAVGVAPGRAGKSSRGPSAPRAPGARRARGRRRRSAGRHRRGAA